MRIPKKEGFLNLSEYSRKYNIPMSTLQNRIKKQLIKPEHIHEYHIPLILLEDQPNIFTQSIH